MHIMTVFPKNVYTLFASSVIILMYASRVLTQCFNNRYIDDTYLADDVYDSFVSPTLMDCVARCYVHSECQSVGFEPNTLKCHRHPQNSTLAPNDLRVLPGWVHSDKDAWPESILGQCSGVLCGASEECMVSRAEVPICNEVTTHSRTLTTADFTELTQCPSPIRLLNANISDGMLVVGSVRTYTCLQGYRDLSSHSVTANTTCLQNLTWSNVDLQCSAHTNEQPQCPSPPPLQNANLSDGMLVVGSVRTYTCLQGYRDLSSNSVTANTTCLQNLTWSHVSLQCSAPWIRKSTPSLRSFKYVQLTAEELKRTYINNSFIFLVKTCHDANFNFDRYQAVSRRALDRIIIGGNNNSHTHIRGKRCYGIRSYGILSCTEYRPFWVEVHGSTISVGKGLTVGYRELVSCTVPDLIVTDWSISTYLNNAGSWLFKIRSTV